MFEIIATVLSLGALAYLLNGAPWNFGAEMVTPEGVSSDADPEPPAWQRSLMFKKGGGSAPDADPRIGEAALKNAETGRQWKEFAEKQFARESDRQEDIDAMTKKIGQQQLETSKRTSEWSQEDRQRYEEQYRPLEDDLLEDAKTWDSGERQEKMAAEAKADVLTNAQQSKESNRRSMASMGIKPGSGRYAGIERASDFNTTLAAAGAENTARNTARSQGVAMRADAANMGRGLPSQAAQGASLGLQAGNSAQGQYLNAAGNARANTGIMSQGYSGQMQGNTSMANIMNQQHSNELQAWSANQQASGAAMSGIGQMVGSGVGAYMASSKDYKTDKKKLKGMALDAIKSMPIERWRYKDGHGDGGEHIGGYAEDFKRETGSGDGKSIPVVDAIGVTMKAVQELDEKIDRALPALDDVKRRKSPAKKRSKA